MTMQKSRAKKSRKRESPKRGGVTGNKKKKRPATAKPMKTRFVSEESGFEAASKTGGFKTEKERKAFIKARRSHPSRLLKIKGGKSRGRLEAKVISKTSTVGPRRGRVSPTHTAQTPSSTGRGKGSRRRR